MKEDFNNIFTQKIFRGYHVHLFFIARLTVHVFQEERQIMARP